MPRKPTHYMKRGMVVMIRNSTIDGHMVEEGYAKLVKWIGHETAMKEIWMVRFENERELYRRVVNDMDYQEAIDKA